MKAPGSREDRLRLARTLVVAHPGWGKDHVNRAVKDAFGVGLRRIDVAHLKDETLLGRPKRSTGLATAETLVRRKLLPQDVLTRKRDTTPGHALVVGFDKAYHEMRSAGFIDQEIKKLLSTPNAPEVFNTAPFRDMLKNRRHWYHSRRKAGWTQAQVINTILDYYTKAKHSPFDFLRKAYRPPAKMDLKAYRRTARRDASRKTGGFFRRTRPAGTVTGMWMSCPSCKHVYWGSTLSGQMPKCPACGR